MSEMARVRCIVEVKVPYIKAHSPYGWGPVVTAEAIKQALEYNVELVEVITVDDYEVPKYEEDEDPPCPDCGKRYDNHDETCSFYVEECMCFEQPCFCDSFSVRREQPGNLVFRDIENRRSA